MVAADQNQSAATAPIGHSFNTTPPALCTQCAVALLIEDGSIEVNRWNHRPSEARFHTTCSDPLLTRASVRGRLESSITASVALVAPMRAQVIANGQVVASGVALMATGALTDCS